jgi:hypothetical protein
LELASESLNLLEEYSIACVNLFVCHDNYRKFNFISYHGTN